MRLNLLFILLLVSIENISAQDSSSVRITGRAFDSSSPNKRLEDLMIINMRTSQGIFGKADGNFALTILKSDTVLIASTGYEYKRITVVDSVWQPSYFINVPLIKLNVNLKEVTIFSPRSLDSIYQDIQKLGYNKHDFQLSNINAIESPITFLYQEFSRFEKLRRHNAERINEDKRRDLLKDLLANFVSADIINLSHEEFDDFIDFCNVPEEYMKNSTQYEFCVYIKQKFEMYRYVRSTHK